MAVVLSVLGCIAFVVGLSAIASHLEDKRRNDCIKKAMRPRD